MTAFSKAALFDSHIGGARAIMRGLASEMRVTHETTLQDFTMRLPMLAKRADVAANTWLAGAARSVPDSPAVQGIVAHARSQAAAAVAELDTLLATPMHRVEAHATLNAFERARRNLLDSARAASLARLQDPQRTAQVRAALDMRATTPVKSRP